MRVERTKLRIRWCLYPHESERQPKQPARTGCRLTMPKVSLDAVANQRVPWLLLIPYCG